MEHTKQERNSRRYHKVASQISKTSFILETRREERPVSHTLKVERPNNLGKKGVTFPRFDRKIEGRYLIGYFTSLFSCMNKSFRQDNSKSIPIIKIPVNLQLYILSQAYQTWFCHNWSRNTHSVAVYCHTTV